MTLYTAIDATLADGTPFRFSLGLNSEHLGHAPGEAADEIGKMIREGMLVTTGDSRDGWVNLAQVVRIRISEVPLGAPRPARYPALDIWSRGNDDTEES